jgi:hypothetical protein
LKRRCVVDKPSEIPVSADPQLAGVRLPEASDFVHLFETQGAEKRLYCGDGEPWKGKVVPSVKGRRVCPDCQRRLDAQRQAEGGE